MEGWMDAAVRKNTSLSMSTEPNSLLLNFTTYTLCSIVHHVASNCLKTQCAALMRGIKLRYIYEVPSHIYILYIGPTQINTSIHTYVQSYLNDAWMNTWMDRLIGG